MTNIPVKVVVDCSTGEETIVPFTAEEIAEQEAAYALYLEQQVQIQAEEAAKAAIKASALAKLAALGLTEEEASAIAGI